MTTHSIKRLFDNNRRWSKQMTKDNPEFFATLAHQQSPEYLWIGCADSRVPANEIIGLLPGEVFVHRNVANVINHTDLNALTVMQYAVDVLKVGHMMVVGHYGCGGVHCTLESTRVGLADNWLRHVQDVQIKHQDRLKRLPKKHRLNALCELNVLEQVANAARTTVVSDAWKRGQDFTVHAWVYGLQDGRVRDLGLSLSSLNGLLKKLDRAADAVEARWANSDA